VKGCLTEIPEESKEVLTIAEIAVVLRCSKAYVKYALDGKLMGLPRMTHLLLGRKKVVRREWLDEWMESNKAS
jgi:excisionase family DNA binding protein